MNYIYTRLYLYTVSGRTSTGKPYKIYKSDQLGFEVTVNINGESTQFLHDEDDGAIYINYVPRFARLKLDGKGYFCLDVIDPKDLNNKR